MYVLWGGMMPCCMFRCMLVCVCVCVCEFRIQVLNLILLRLIHKTQ